MATAGDVLRQSLPEVGVGELHVLAVDDSFVDRKVIERLLKFTSCKGKYNKDHKFDDPFVFFFMYWIVNFFFSDGYCSDCGREWN
jgi:hypothetical protein